MKEDESKSRIILFYFLNITEQVLEPKRDISYFKITMCCRHPFLKAHTAGLNIVTV